MLRTQRVTEEGEGMEESSDSSRVTPRDIEIAVIWSWV